MRRFAEASPFLAFAALLAASSSAPASAQTVEGRLIESETGRTIPYGIVTLTDTVGTIKTTVLSDTTGHFRLEAPGPGSYLVVAGGLGYASAADGILDLGDDGFIEIDFYLRPRPVELPGLLATVDRIKSERYLDRQGFYERQQMGFGHFIGPDELEERQPFDTQDLLRRAPGIRVVEGGFAGETVVCRDGRNWSPPRVYLDGVQVSAAGSGADLELMVGNIEDIAAVEVFTRASQLPLEYGGTGGSCVILVWTKGHR